MEHDRWNHKRWLKYRTVLIMLCICCLSGGSAQVREAWIARYSGPGYGWDFPSALKADSQGNIYVTGLSRGLTSNYDFLTIKYSASGRVLWTARYDGPQGSHDVSYAIALDPQGNVYVTGYSWTDVNTREDFLTIKYSPNGHQLWVRRYAGVGNSGDVGYLLAIDHEGNVYVGGGGRGISGTHDFIILKYSSSGNQLWVREYNGPGNGRDALAAMALDVQGNIYVAGSSLGQDTDVDYAVVKYSPAGDLLWTRRYNGPDNWYDYANALAVDRDGNVYVTGESFGGYATYTDYATVKFSPTGERLWVARYNGTESRYDWATAIAVDHDQNVYVTGTSRGIGTYTDFATVKYSPQGEQLWAARYNSPVNAGDEATAISMDGQGNVCITGTSAGFATIKYSPSGQLLWVMRYNVGYWHNATALAVDNEDNVIITGRASYEDTSYDFITIKYAPTPRGDVNNNGCVDDADLIAILFRFGSTGSGMPEDLNRDGVVNELDLLEVLFYFGTGC